MANLWTEFAAQRGETVATNGKEPQNPKKLLVAATFAKAKPYAFAEPVIHIPKYDQLSTERKFDQPDLKRSSQLLEETEHFCRWRQEKVAKIVQYGPPVLKNILHSCA